MEETRPWSVGAPEGVYGMVRDLSPLVKLLTPGGTESHAALTKVGDGTGRDGTGR